MLDRKRQVEGVVVSDKSDKSIVVKVERSWRHPLYGKVVKTAKKYHAHDENNEAREGDRVRLQESRPMSKMKKWVLLEIVERPERV